MINYRIDFDSLLSKLLKLDINSISWYYYIICITENSIYYLKKTFEITFDIWFKDYHEKNSRIRN